MSFLYFVLVMLVPPIFAYRLYKTVQEHPNVFIGVPGRIKAKKIYIAFIGLSVVSGAILACAFSAELWKRLFFVISVFISSFVVVVYLTNQEKVEAVAANLFGSKKSEENNRQGGKEE